jgi:hypothetical protein
MADEHYHLVDISLSEALEAYTINQVATGHDIVRVMQRIMRYWISLVVKGLPKPDREKIQSYLVQVTANAPRRPSHSSRLKPNARPGAVKSAAARDALRNSRAAGIVAALNIYGARSAPAAAFYRSVQRWISRRTRSSGLLKSGFLPAFRVLGKGEDPPGPSPQQGSPPGLIRQDFADAAASILVENWAAQRQVGKRQVLGIAGLAPDAFSNAMPELEKIYTGLLMKNLRQQGARLGFEVT